MSGRARARQVAERERGDLVDPWTGERALPSQGGGLADPWANVSTSSSMPSSTSSASTAPQKLHWLFRASDREAAQSAASVTLEKAVRALRATAPLNFAYRSIAVQAASADLGAGKWYATVSVDDPVALGRLRAELGRTSGVQVLA